MSSGQSVRQRAGDAHQFLTLTRDSLDNLIPGYLAYDRDMVITGVGPALRRILGPKSITGQRFDQAFSVIRPPHNTRDSLPGTAQRLLLGFRADRRVALRAVAVRMWGAGETVLATELISRHTPDLPYKSDEFLRQFLADQTLMLGNMARDGTPNSRAFARALERIDTLTGLPNRIALVEFLDGLIVSNSLKNTPLTLFNVDLRHFRAVNDQYGSHIGDRILCNIAHILREKIRSGDLVARSGGDKFTLAMRNPCTPDDIRTTANRLIARIDAPMIVEQHSVNLHTCIGAVHVRTIAQHDAHRLILDADLALAEAREARDTPFALFTPKLRVRFEQMNRLSQQIETGLCHDQFEPWFQPQVNAQTGKVVGFEALARWNHPDRGVLSPIHFLYVAGQDSLMDRIDSVMIDKSFGAFAKWRRDGLNAGQISVNLSLSRLAQSDFVERLKWAADQHDLDPGLIGLEILETVLLEDEDSTLVDRLKSLAAHGFHLELDDFGTGHSSIANLRKFRVDRLKIDRGFVSGIDRDINLQKITGAIIALAQALGIAPLAEGVETRAEGQMLANLGCSLFQGFGIARPMPGHIVPEWLKNFNCTGRDIWAA